MERKDKQPNRTEKTLEPSTTNSENTVSGDEAKEEVDLGSSSGEKVTPVTVEKCNTVDPASIHDHDTEGVSLLLGMRDSIIASEEKANLEKNKLKRGGGALNEHEYFSPTKQVRKTLDTEEASTSDEDIDQEDKTPNEEVSSNNQDVNCVIDHVDETANKEEEEVAKVVRTEEVTTVDEDSHEPVYKCAFCDQFHTKSELKKHIQKHVGDKPYHCDHCSKTFSGRGPLQSHLRIHNRSTAVKCTVCNEAVRDKSALSAHMKIHITNPPYKCWFCSQTFIKNEHLQNHLRIHAGEKPYKCEECGKSFSYSSNYKVHVRLHTGDRPYKCGVCDETFRQLHSLKAHQSKHTGEKPYRCGICDKQFLHKRSLQFHLRIHSADCEIEKMHAEDIPGRCDACKTLFTAKMDLLRRIKINSGERPYGCRECGECFLEADALKSHFRQHAKESTKGCLICGKGDEGVTPKNAYLDIHKHMKTMRLQLRGFKRGFKREVSLMKKEIGMMKKSDEDSNEEECVSPEIKFDEENELREEKLDHQIISHEEVVN